MAKAFFNVFLKLITNICNIVLHPINLLLTNFFPDFSNVINTFNETLTLIGGNALDYIVHLIPPTTLSVIQIYLTIVVSYYTISISIHVILKVWTIIKNIKIW